MYFSVFVFVHIFFLMDVSIILIEWSVTLTWCHHANKAETLNETQNKIWNLVIFYLPLILAILT